MPQDEGDGLLAGQPGQRGPHAAALVEGHDRVGDVGGDGVAVAGGLLAGGAAAAGAEVVQRGVRRGDGQPAQSPRPAGTEERPNVRNTSCATSSASSREPSTRAATATTRG